MKKLQRFRNDKNGLICDNPECQTLINVGDFAVKEKRPKILGGDKNYHERCAPK